ncbi:hypothetical protein SUGI_0644970 [Cryptomeria japonica]|nr:hypothetical protein SUGI_0644970 [Cryptomeria japonica]
MWCEVMRFKYLDLDDPMRILTMANSQGGSPIWKFLWESRGIIMDHLSWSIGNGRKVTFWKDSRSRGIALEDIMEDKDVISDLEDRLGESMIDYFQADSQIGSVVEWTIKDEGLINNNDKEKIMAELWSRKVVMGEQDDAIICRATALGEYSVKLGYEVMKRRSRARWFVGLCWNSRVAPRAGAFLWVMLHNNILTRERLKKNGIAWLSICPLCVNAEEDTNHLLFECNLTT